MNVFRERIRHRAGLAGPRPGRSGAKINEGFHHPIAMALRLPLLNCYKELFADTIDAEVTEAGTLQAHCFNLLGHPVKHGNKIDWHFDPVSGKRWSRGFSADISFRGPNRLGDIKLPWELNKHQYFFTLGKAAWLLNDSAPAMEIVRQIENWIDDNPWYCGINWISALESGTRAISWILAYPFFANHCDQRFKERFVESLYQHIIFVERNLSAGCFTNTHLVGESAALVIGGLFLECRQSRRWVKKGLSLLEQAIKNQVSNDGVHLEQSVAYHRFFLDHYHLVHAILLTNGRKFNFNTVQIMERMTEFLMDVMHPDGSVPAFGDNDDARGIWLQANCPVDYQSLIALGALIFQRSEFKGTVKGLCEEIFWLYGIQGVKKFQSIPNKLPSHSSMAYDKGGYYIMREGWGNFSSLLVFDCGSLGYGPAGHGHADALSLQLFTGGYNFLVDSGTYSYNLDYNWRDMFRSTRAHNTVVVDGQDQSIPKDRMSWSFRATVCCNSWYSTAWFDIVDGEHSGYQRLSDSVRHRRVIIYIKPDTWLVWDLLEGRGHHNFESLFHLKPDCEIRTDTEGGCFVLVSPRKSQLKLWIVGEDGTDIEPRILTGNGKERAVWWSPGYGIKIPTKAVSLIRDFSEKDSTITCFSTSNMVKHNLKGLDGAIGGEIWQCGEWKTTLFYSDGVKRNYEKAGIKFHGDLFYHRDEIGSPQIFLARGFKKFSIFGLLDLQSNFSVDSLILKGSQCAIELSQEHIGDLRLNITKRIQLVINGQAVPNNEIENFLSNHRV